MTSHEDLPYRPCVGVMLISRQGLVFVGRRSDGPEHVDATHAWQMPQGGIDSHEDPYPAALRELYEETNVQSVEKLGETRDWLAYDLPPEVARKAWKGRYRGQRQKWFALRFTGPEAEIDVLHPAGGAHHPEFVDWRWESIDRLAELVIPFKRAIYRQVVAEFAPLVRPQPTVGR